MLSIYHRELFLSSYIKPWASPSSRLIHRWGDCTIYIGHNSLFEASDNQAHAELSWDLRPFELWFWHLVLAKQKHLFLSALAWLVPLGTNNRHLWRKLLLWLFAHLRLQSKAGALGSCSRPWSAPPGHWVSLQRPLQVCEVPKWGRACTDNWIFSQKLSSIIEVFLASCGNPPTHGPRSHPRGASPLPSVTAAAGRPLILAPSAVFWFFSWYLSLGFRLSVDSTQKWRMALPHFFALKHHHWGIQSQKSHWKTTLSDRVLPDVGTIWSGRIGTGPFFPSLCSSVLPPLSQSLSNALKAKNNSLFSLSKTPKESCVSTHANNC